MSLGAMLCVVAMGLGQAPATVEPFVETEQKPWTSLDVNNDADSFQFAIVTDRTGGHRPGIFMDGVNKLNLLQPEFVMSVGDLIEGYTEDREQLAREWNEFMGFTALLDMPFFYVPGNHDITNDIMREEWNNRFGRSYYHFLYQDCLFLALDSQDPKVFDISPRQVEFVRETLAANTDVRWTFVFIHAPLWSYGNNAGWKQVEELLAGRPHNCFAGHTHHFYNRTINDTQYITLGTLGGGSRLRGPNFGEFDHFLWVTMKDDGPVLASLMLDGIWDTNIVSDERMELVRPLLDGTAVRTDGIVFDEGTFTDADTNLRFVNDANIPMQVTWRPIQNDVLGTNRPGITREVPPNNVEIVPIKVMAWEPTDVDELPALVSEYTVSYAIDGHVNPVTVEGQHRIVIDRAYSVFDAPETVTIDGNLDEWGALAVQPKEPGHVKAPVGAWNGNRDGSVDFTIAEGNGMLYVAAETFDDFARYEPERRVEQQDSIEVFFDFRPERARQASSSYSDFVRMGFAPGINAYKTLEEAQQAGIEAQCKRYREGMRLELAIPMALVEELVGTTPDSIRFNIGIRDVDPDGDAMVYWRADWESPAAYIESGTFRRAAK